MANDLASDPAFSVTVADASAVTLGPLKANGIRTIPADLSDGSALAGLLEGQDLVISAVPGFMGYRTLERIIGAGRDVVDIAFFPEDPAPLAGLAEERGVRAVLDCGVAPGMSNLLAGHVDALLDTTESVLIYVGGLPQKREWPFEYKAPFSPVDVIEEYTRPSRFIEGGELVVRPALSEPELLEFPGIGTLEAFNTDGLRSLAHTLTAPDMKEKTLRYPGHIEQMRMLRETGFFSPEPVEVNGVEVSPLELTAQLLFKEWQYQPGEADLTVMQVIVEGVRSGERVRYRYDLLDRYDPVTGVSSMARTTGYTATMMLRLLDKGLHTRPGLVYPEEIGRDEASYRFILEGLAERGIDYRESTEALD
jgi:saccharopine dehydrogenase-like NADP-dependent oxidoreductase